MIGKIEATIWRTQDWMSWLDALDMLVEQQRGPHLRDLNVTYCLDTSEVAEHARPVSRRQHESGYPTPLDLALLILFAAGRRRHLLPPHFVELQALQDDWADQLRLDAHKLNLLSDLLHRLGQREDESLVRELVNFMLRERDLFDRLLEEQRSLEDLVKHISPLGRDFLEGKGVTGWTYEADAARVDDWYVALSSVKPDLPRRGNRESSKRSDRSSAQYRVDAHALCYLEDLNARLPDEEVVILSTHSWRIWKIVHERRAREEAASGIPRTLMKRGRSFLEMPQTILVKKLLAGSSSPASLDEMQNMLIIERERLQTIKQLRAQLKDEVLPYVKKGNLTPRSLREIKGLIANLSNELADLKAATQGRQILSLLGLATAGTDHDVRLGGLLKAIRGGQRAILTRVVQERRQEIAHLVDELQQRVGLAVPTTPATALSFTFGGAAHDAPGGFPKAMLHGHGSGAAYEINFQSPSVNDSLQIMQRQLDVLDSAPHHSGEFRAAKIRLQAEMYHCRTTLAEDPELYLLLATVYCSRQMWFQAFDAADQGIKLLPITELDSVGQRSSRAELLFIGGAALHNWALEGYADIPNLAAALLARAAEPLRTSMRLQGDLARGAGMEGFLDPRCLREIGTIYGDAHEVGVTIPIHEDDARLVDLDASGTDARLSLYLEFAERAMERAREEDPMRVYYANSLLYAICERDPKGLEHRGNGLAAVIDSAPLADEDPNLLDTRAWFRFRMAQLKQGGGEFSAAKALRSEASSLIAKAQTRLKAAQQPNRYYNDLIAKHQRQILASSAQTKASPRVP